MEPTNSEALRGRAKTARIPIKVESVVALPRPAWIRVRPSGSETFRQVKSALREAQLHTPPGNLPVRRYVAPATFAALARPARQLGFTHAASGPLVRSSYHADQQAQAAGI